jgi:hypothetical protein
LQVTVHEIGEPVNGRGEVQEAHPWQEVADEGAELTQAAA